MGALFGTDGVRGVAGQPPLDQKTIYKLAFHLTNVLREKSPQPRILVARDTRASGVWIEQVLARGAEKAGGSIVRAGVISTPGVSFLTRSLQFDAGIVISASHNPYQDNGIKIFADNGIKLSDDLELRLEKEILAPGPDPRLEPVEESEDSLCDLRFFQRSFFESYVNFLLSSVKSGLDLQGMRMVIDCANGATFKLAPKVFSELGAQPVVIHAQPDGYNINLLCGSTHLEAAERAVSESGAELGISFDGDADRALFTDSQGRTIDGDYILYLFAKHLPLKKPSVVATVMSNIGLEIALQKQGIKLIRTQVGDRYVLEEMLRSGVNVGGEQSGHIILSDYALAGDGLLTALKVLELMAEHRCSLADLAGGMQKFPQVLVNLRVKEKVPLEKFPEIQGQIAASKSHMGADSRILVRYSGTEPLVRIMVEGADQQQIEAEAKKIANIVQQMLG